MHCVLKRSFYPQLWSRGMQILQIWRKDQYKGWDISFVLIKQPFLLFFVENKKIQLSGSIIFDFV